MKIAIAYLLTDLIPVGVMFWLSMALARDHAGPAAFGSCCAAYCAGAWSARLRAALRVKVAQGEMTEADEAGVEKRARELEGREPGSVYAEDLRRALSAYRTMKSKAMRYERLLISARYLSLTLAWALAVLLERVFQ